MHRVLEDEVQQDFMDGVEQVDEGSDSVEMGRTRAKPMKKEKKQGRKAGKGKGGGSGARGKGGRMDAAGSCFYASQLAENWSSSTQAPKPAPP